MDAETNDRSLIRIAVLVAGLGTALALGGCGRADEAEPAGGAEKPGTTNSSLSEDGFYETRATCSTRTFHVEFDSAGSVDVTDGSALLASATFEDRQLGSVCATDVEKIPITGESATPYRDHELGPVNHKSTSLECESPTPVEASVHPIWNEANQIIGSSVVVAAEIEGNPTLLVTAPMKPGRNAVHLYFASKYCEVV